MTIENKLGITNSAELAKEEERLSKMITYNKLRKFNSKR